MKCFTAIASSTKIYYKPKLPKQGPAYSFALSHTQYYNDIVGSFVTDFRKLHFTHTRQLETKWTLGVLVELHSRLASAITAVRNLHSTIRSFI